jgi:hypothetical protein
VHNQTINLSSVINEIEIVVHQSSTMANACSSDTNLAESSGDDVQQQVKHEQQVEVEPEHVEPDQQIDPASMKIQQQLREDAGNDDLLDVCGKKRKVEIYYGDAATVVDDVAAAPVVVAPEDDFKLKVGDYMLRLWDYYNYEITEHFTRDIHKVTAALKEKKESKRIQKP